MMKNIDMADRDTLKNIYKKLSYVLLHAIGQSYIYPSDLTFIDEVEEV